MGKIAKVGWKLRTHACLEKCGPCVTVIWLVTYICALPSTYLPAYLPAYLPTFDWQENADQEACC